MTEINKQPTTEAGRSMVEMLGVLAIIGVLSIGGIAGYTHAMNKSKANDILDGVSKRAVVVSQQMIMGGTASLVEYKNKKIGDCSVTLSENDYGNGFFGIQVSGIEQSVCERLQGQGLANAADIYLGDAYFDEATCAEGNGNVLTYVFNDSLNANAVSEGGGAGTPRDCWVTGDCTEDDADSIYEEWCVDPRTGEEGLFPIMYCKDPENFYEGSYESYEECRNNGNSILFCSLEALGHPDPSETTIERYETCIDKGIDFFCCGCVFESPWALEECIEFGYCPADALSKW